MATGLVSDPSPAVSERTRPSGIGMDHTKCHKAGKTVKPAFWGARFEAQGQGAGQ
jgi:hypothetical protein